MIRSVIVVDDFLPDPHIVRNAALAQEFPKLDKPQFYPGRDSKFRQVLNGYDQRIIELIGEPVVPVQTSSHAKFRLALEGDKGTESVHIDNVHWTAILYLTLPEHCQDGTHLFRHKATNTDHAPYNSMELQELGFASQQTFLDDVINKNTNDPSAWEHLMTVPMRFNRLLIIKPQQYHDAGISFGDSPENGRLIYVCAYNYPGATKMTAPE
ncbi:MAG: hypothetical protein JJ850_05540 [Kordiimonadaceae bacterium]|nr:hypothetical protein [Kordiimonadaceae bacterium]MBO6568214.1 hypothetical protein [Kordiimonadaceae bacterium]MBO6964056.1 hypothetical protein [Kordiimonadaceae bacterium]